MQSIIVNAIMDSDDIPINLDKKRKKEFAQEVAKICEKRAFDKSRDDFKNEITNLVNETISKFEG